MYLWDRKIHNLHSAYKYLHVRDSIPQIIDPSYTLSIFLDCKPRGLNCQQETLGGDVFTSDLDWCFSQPEDASKYVSTHTGKPCNPNDP